MTKFTKITLITTMCLIVSCVSKKETHQQQKYHLSMFGFVTPEQQLISARKYYCLYDMDNNNVVNPADASIINANLRCQVNNGNFECDRADLSKNNVVTPSDRGFIFANIGPCNTNRLFPLSKFEVINNILFSINDNELTTLSVATPNNFQNIKPLPNNDEQNNKVTNFAISKNGQLAYITYNDNPTIIKICQILESNVNTVNIITQNHLQAPDNAKNVKAISLDKDNNILYVAVGGIGINSFIAVLDVNNINQPTLISKINNQDPARKYFNFQEYSQYDAQYFIQYAGNKIITKTATRQNINEAYKNTISVYNVQNPIEPILIGDINYDYKTTFTSNGQYLAILDRKWPQWSGDTNTSNLKIFKLENDIITQTVNEQSITVDSISNFDQNNNVYLLHDNNLFRSRDYQLYPVSVTKMSTTGTYQIVTQLKNKEVLGKGNSFSGDGLRLTSVENRDNVEYLIMIGQFGVFSYQVN